MPAIINGFKALVMAGGFLSESILNYRIAKDTKASCK